MAERSLLTRLISAKSGGIVSKALQPSGRKSLLSCVDVVVGFENYWSSMNTCRPDVVPCQDILGIVS